MARTSSGGQSPVSPSGIAALFGLDPVVAALVVSVDVMLTALDFSVIGWPVSCAVAAALMVPCFIMQRKRYGDDAGVALAKAVAVGILTAIPTPIPSVLTASAGVLGYRRLKTRDGA
jgi:hypothetical protein